MSPTILERDMLKTRIEERSLDVTTALHQTHARACPPWTGIWEHQDGRAESIRLVWLHFWPQPHTPGGVAEAHEHVVPQVVQGEIPALDEEWPTRWRERLRTRKEAEQHAQLAPATE